MSVHTDTAADSDTNDGRQPRYPVYVVSYNRAGSALTPAALDECNIDYTLVIEADDAEQTAYKQAYPDANIITVPQSYHEQYETYDNIGNEKSRGPGPARNYAWDHALDNGYDRYWVMDDNIKHFYHYTENMHIPLATPAGFRCMEDFARQYDNLAMVGPRYFMFITRKSSHPPLTFNTRVYSCNLIQTHLPYRWAGRYNEDTDLSLRMLKDGHCTALFNTFLQEKIETQRLDGGNTENFYKYEGTYNKSKMLKQRHPDVTEITKRYGRWHHHVDYSPFKSNELQKKPDPPPTDTYDFTVIPETDAETT